LSRKKFGTILPFVGKYFLERDKMGHSAAQPELKNEPEKRGDDETGKETVYLDRR
jgi:hypothetical protein